MFLYIGKILTALATPLGLAIAVLALAAFAPRRLPRALVAVAAVVLLFSSSGWCSRLLLRTLEQPYAESSIASAPVAQAIVVLGGYLRVETRIPRPVEIGGTADRLFCAAELYRAGKAPVILLSGGNVTFFTPASALPEAEEGSRILQVWGIPASAILIEGRSQNTHENAVFSQRILAGKGINRILLVTSAFHMRRAAGTFRRTGLTVVPFAADFLAEGDPPDLLLSVFPEASALANSGLAIKEWLGITVYRLRGWAY